MCAGGPGEKHLHTQFINKSLPAPNTYPVRIYIDITYSFTECPKQGCDVELHIENYPERFSYGDGPIIIPDNHIQGTNETSNGTKRFYFTPSTLYTGFTLTLISGKGCVTVSRVLVYRYECPGHDRQPTLDLGRRPATQAPATASVLVTSHCAENSNFTGQEPSMSLQCLSFGHWSGAPLQCQCDVGYSRNGDICEGKTDSQASQLLCIHFSAEEQVSTQLSATSSFTVSPSALPSPQSTDRTTENPTVTAAEGSSGGPSIAILAGVAAVIVVILFLVVIVALIIAVVRNKRKLKPNDPDTTENVAYETIATLPVIPRYEYLADHVPFTCDQLLLHSVVLKLSKGKGLTVIFAS